MEAAEEEKTKVKLPIGATCEENPEKIVTIVCTIVAGLGFGLYQLKNKIQESKEDKKGLGDWQQQIDQMQQQAQYYRGPGGQWQQ